MRKLIKKNQRIVLVIFGVLLMIMFLSNLGPQQSSRPSPLLHQVATLDGAKINQLQINNYAEEWQTLRSSIDFVNLNDSSDTPMPFAERVLGRELTAEIDQAQKSSKTSPPFFLLVQETDRQGISVSEEELQSIITNNVYPQTQPGTDERERVQQAVMDCLKIVKLANRAGNVVKVSRPYQQYMLANIGQNLSVNAETIRASSLLSQIPTPTDAEVSAQYDKYSDRVAAVADRTPTEFGQASDPLGFGYKVPNRVTVQYIGLNEKNVHDAAVASKSNEDWYVAAFGEFKAHRADYDARPVPTSQPAASTAPSSGVKALDNLNDDFELHAPLVLAKIQQDQTKALAQTILREINERLSSGYGTYRDALASGNKEMTGPAADYISYNYLRDLADSIKAKFGVTPILGNIQQPKSEEQLGQLENIGAAAVLNSGGNVTFPVYAVQLFQPWLSDADKNSLRGALAIAPWQPSNPLEDWQHNLYVFRISSGDPAHVPRLSEVKDQVIADCKIAAAYAKALQISHALLTSANKSGLTAAAIQAKLAPPILTDPFSPEALNSGRAAPVISPLILSSDSAREFATVSQQLLITPPAQNNRPQLLAELYPDRTVAVMELQEAKPNWDAETKPLVTDEIVKELQYAEGLPLELTLFKPDSVASRMGYQPVSR